jgi:gamma-glutamyltranspeptidase / glutathione hydrolase
MNVRALWLFASLPLLPLAIPCGRPARSAEGATFHKYAVAADNADASAAGAAILAEGGSAADAAAATMLALGVASPTGSGLGGGGFALYYRARDKSLTFLDFRETAPGATTPDLFRARQGESAEQSSGRSRSGGLAVGVPGEPLGIAELVKRFGKRPLATIVKPAEELARKGFGVSEHTARLIAMRGDSIKDPLLTSVFGSAALTARRTTNVALADTLQRFGREGAKLFYTGALAKAIVRTAKAHGGILSEGDLAAYRVVERAPARGTRLGYDWVTAALPSAGGYTILNSLALLEAWLPSAAHWQSNERYHALIESWKGAYLDRQGYFGDPDHVQVPLAELSTVERVNERATRYHPALALPGEAYELPLARAPGTAKQPDNRGTSHLCVVDQEGNIAAVTTTVNLMLGAGISVGGFWLNDEMDDFAREVGKANAFGLVGGAANLPGPRKRPVSSMSPTIVLADGQPVLCIGGSGGSRIPTAVEQVALYVLKDGMHPSRAVVAPRLHHQVDPDQVDARDLPEPALRELSARGHRVTTTQWAAHVQAIRIRAASGSEERTLEPASDPAKGGEPRGE